MYIHIFPFRLKKVQEKKKKIKAFDEAQKVKLAAETGVKDEDAPSIFDDFRDPEILFD